MHAIKTYIVGLSSLRIIAQELGVTPATIYTWLFQLGSHGKDPLHIAQELKPRWYGYLAIDGKSIFILGIEHVLLLACDVKSQDIVHAQLTLGENHQSFLQFLTAIKEQIHYPLIAVTIDLRRGLQSAVQLTFPKAPVQACVVHRSRQLDMRLPKGKKRSKFRRQNQILKALIRKVLFANDFEEAEWHFWYLLGEEPKFQKKAPRSVITMIKRNFWLTVTHFFVPELSRDNNGIENIIKQLHRKLKLSGGFHNPDSAWAMIKLLILGYRFKAFTDSKTPGFNGKNSSGVSRR
ncbi:MAG: transposase [bacterium]|nr:transposase [bacterium]